MNSQKYERFIQRVRIGCATLFTVCGLGLVVCANMRFELATAVFGIAFAASFAIVPLLMIEQLVATWMATRHGRISLAALMILMAISGLFFAVMRESVGAALTLLALAVTIVSTAIESKRKPRSEVSDEPDSQPLD